MATPPAPAPAATPTPSPLQQGQLVVLAGRLGVFRLERPVPPTRWRAFGYSDGVFVVVEAAEVSPCPPGTRADGALPSS